MPPFSVTGTTSLEELAVDLTRLPDEDLISLVMEIDYQVSDLAFTRELWCRLGRVIREEDDAEE